MLSYEERMLSELDGNEEKFFQNYSQEENDDLIGQNARLYLGFCLLKDSNFKGHHQKDDFY